MRHLLTTYALIIAALVLLYLLAVRSFMRAPRRRDERRLENSREPTAARAQERNIR